MSEKINLAETIKLPQLSMPKDEAIKYFGFEGHESTFQRLLAEFKVHPDYKSGYRAPTYKIVLININLFDQFLDWKDKNKFK